MVSDELHDCLWGNATLSYNLGQEFKLEYSQCLIVCKYGMIEAIHLLLWFPWLGGRLGMVHRPARKER